MIKPSHLLRKMKQLADTILGEDILKTLWLQRLPNQVQAILSVSEDSLDKLALMADKIHETAGASVEAVHCPNNSAFDVSELRTQLAELTEEVKRLSRDRERKSSFSRRKRSKTPKKFDRCWYHFKFGEAAKRCQSPCRFKKTGN